MAKNYFDRYVWLIDTVSRHGHIPFKHISDLWEDSSLNDRPGEPLSNRTFFNHLEAIFDTFGIEIKCDRALGYYIANGEDLEADGIKQWLLESLSMSNLLNESKDMRDRILFEKIPSSQRWLSTIVNTIRDGKAVEVTYQSFSRNEPSTFIAHPYCLKLFKQRWYMLAKSEEKEEIRIYALDERMMNVSPTQKSLVVPKDFDGRAYFSDYFGIIVGSDCTPTLVDLKVAAGQVKYIETLKLHESQTVLKTTPEYTIYRLYLVPTFDFRQEILSHGPDYEVLSPEWFRDEVKGDILGMMKNYGL